MVTVIQVTTPPTLDFLSKIPEKSCEESTKIPKRVADVAFQATDGTDGIDSASIANKGKRRFFTLNLSPATLSYLL